MRGQGRIFQRNGSSALWCAYYLRGKEFRESTGTADQDKAEKFLKRRLREVGADVIGAKQFVGPQSDRINVSCGVIAEEQRKPGDPNPYVVGKETVNRYLTVAEECGKATLLAAKAQQ